MLKYPQDRTPSRQAACQRPILHLAVFGPSAPREADPLAGVLQAGRHAVDGQQKQPLGQHPLARARSSGSHGPPVFENPPNSATTWPRIRTQAKLRATWSQLSAARGGITGPWPSFVPARTSPTSPAAHTRTTRQRSCRGGGDGGDAHRGHGYVLDRARARQALPGHSIDRVLTPTSIDPVAEPTYMPRVGAASE